MTPAERAQVFREAAEVVREFEGQSGCNCSSLECDCGDSLNEAAAELDYRASVEETRGIVLERANGAV